MERKKERTEKKRNKVRENEGNKDKSVLGGNMLRENRRTMEQMMSSQRERDSPDKIESPV